MHGTIQDHWLASAQRVPSPNCDERKSNRIDLLVLHNISLPPGEYGGPHIEQFFTNCLPCKAHPFFQAIADLQVSAHLLIRRDGTLLQFVPFNLRAWHAGASCFEGEQGCNEFSIGIELEGTDTDPYDPRQYDRLVCVTQTLMRYYPGIKHERIVGHADIAPQRKTDPGPAFNWQKFRERLALMNNKKFGE